MTSICVDDGAETVGATGAVGIDGGIGEGAGSVVIGGVGVAVIGGVAVGGVVGDVEVAANGMSTES